VVEGDPGRVPHGPPGPSGPPSPHGAGSGRSRSREGVRGPNRPPHVAEMVADRLRQRILDGELADGDLLPKQEELLTEFGVSRPSVREALRILEAEGLVSVRRGKFGGSVVHRPHAANAAYTLGLVLRAGKVPVGDVSAALHMIEPVCASLCATRPDRHETVLPRLREVHEAARDCIDDARAFTIVSRRFHEELVACCGNQTLILVIGALESVWSAHATAWAEQHVVHNEFPDRAYRQRGLDDHELLLRLIERGEAEAVAREAQRHLLWAPVYSVDEENRIFPGLLVDQLDLRAALDPALAERAITERTETDRTQGEMG
jgi:GntR family transcriptional regulator, transcriptional repressor for pyruvate dehydrogenase complex